MRAHKKFFSLMLAFVLAFSLGIPAFAAVEDTGFSDVDAGAWYAEAVMYCREHGLMDGIGNSQFAPENSLTRAQLATVLYRIEGEPAVTGTDAFTDTAGGDLFAIETVQAYPGGHQALLDFAATARSLPPSAPTPTAPLTTARTFSGSWPPARPSWRG